MLDTEWFAFIDPSAILLSVLMGTEVSIVVSTFLFPAIHNVCVYLSLFVGVFYGFV